MKNWPPEIEEFLKRQGIVLLIRGLPGTGKTLFSLTILDSMKNCVYIAPKKVYDDIRRNYSWLKEDSLDRLLIIDGKYKYEHSDRFGNLFFLLPESLKYALNLVEKGEIDTIILDSWHTIVEELKYKVLEERERREIYDPERFFLNLIKLADQGVNLIIAKEGTQEDSLSYVADGVITLKRWIENGRIFRGMEINKLRGVEIRKSEYMFTLGDGKAKILTSGEFQHPKKREEIEKREIRLGFEIPSMVFDGPIKFHRGNTILYDFEEYIPREYHLTVLMPTIANFLKNNIKTVVMPPNDMDLNEIKYQIYLFGLEKYLSHLKIIYPEKEMEDFVEAADFYTLKDLIEKVEGSIEDTDTMPLVVIGYDRLFSFLSPNQIMQLVDYMRNFIRKRGGLLIITGKVSEKSIKRFGAGVSDIYLKFKNINGDIIMYGIKPWTRAYHLNLTSEPGYPKTLMEEIL